MAVSALPFEACLQVTARPLTRLIFASKRNAPASDSCHVGSCQSLSWTAALSIRKLSATGSSPTPRDESIGDGLPAVRSLAHGSPPPMGKRAGKAFRLGSA